MVKLVDFLNSEDGVIFYNHKNDDRYSVAFSKMLTRYPGIIYVFKQTYCENEVFNPFDMDNSFFGVYHKNTNTLYIEDKVGMIYISKYNEYITLDGMDCLELYDVKNELVEEVNSKILNLIGFNKLKLGLDKNDIKEIDQKHAVNKAKRMYISGEAIDKDVYAKYKIGDIRYSLGDIIKYIDDKEYFIDSTTHRYIRENSVQIYSDIEFIETLEMEMERLNSDEDANVRRKIELVFSDRSRKTLNITYKKDGKEMIFKIENKASVVRDNYISVYYIVNAKDRDLFGATYVDEDRFSVEIIPKYIESISYGKNILYKK